LKDFNKVLILTYYWPPSGGSGVQRWMYFAKYLKALGWKPSVITVDEKQASYPVLDHQLLKEVKGIAVLKTDTKEPLKIYSQLISGSLKKVIPQGHVNKKGLIAKFAAFIRGNFFIPDARIGWNAFALSEAKKLIQKEGIQKVITTGPPHSSHLVGLQLKAQFDIQWWADFRDPWTDIFYNKDLYRTVLAQKKDVSWESKVLQNADGILTTVGGNFVQKLTIKAPNQKFHILPNGYDQDLILSVPKTSIKPFHIVYTGLLTDNQDYIPVIKVLNEMADHPHIRLSLAGNINDHILENIRQTAPKIEIDFKGYLPHKEAIALMKSGDLLLNFIFKGADLDMISGKLLEYLATEVPVLSIGDPQSEAGKLLSLASFAQMIDAEDIEAIKAFIEKAFHQRSKAQNQMVDIKKWSRENIAVALSFLLEKS
jgi:glycosyltransferase involved in cell wall biosynthesis